MAEIRPYREKVPKPRMYGGERYSERYIREMLGVIVHAQSGKHGVSQEARVYARAGMAMTGDDLRGNVLYTLSNLGTWHGEIARQVKSVLVGFTGANGLRATR